MRPIITLIVMTLMASLSEAQISLETVPLESNPVLKRKAAQQSKTKANKLIKLFGESPVTNRSAGGDCEDDFVYEDGETVYVLSGESLQICIDTTGFVSFDNLSIDGNSGTISFQDNCINYDADSGLDLGIGDTIRVEFCLPNNGACSTRTFPVVVRRENATFIESATVLGVETDVVLCIDPANYILPIGIASSSIVDCHNTVFANAANGNSTDSCLLLTANRFAGIDTVCLEISNDFCISDTYKFPYRIQGDTLDLPFLDDFSYEGPFPGQLWLDKQAYVNNHLPFQPPSVGAATMDGLDQTGSPYGNGYGRSDFLTSNYLDLSPYDANSNVYLTCYVQPKGYGYYPNENDSLIIEFKKSNGQWTQIHSFQGIDGTISDDSLFPFDDYYSYHINTNEYLYEGFQFRFVNYSDNNGIRDIWHIDYVKLQANNIPDMVFEDIAFTNIPNDILKTYSSIPWNHFENSMLIDSIDIELYSQFDEIETADPSGIIIRELETGAILLNQPVLLLTDAVTGDVNQRNVPPMMHKKYTNPLNNFESLPAFSEDKLVFEMTYSMEVDGQNAGLFPQVARNDTVKSRTTFDNYFAYDDGSAERAAFVGQFQGWQIAVEYEATVPDTLRAVQIHFPHYGSQEQARFSLKVFVGELNGTPVYNKFGLKPFFADTVLDTLQGYTTYRLEDDFGDLAPIAIPAGKFYIALEQSTSMQPTRIGIDYNSPKAQPFQFANIGGPWVSLLNEGALMIRPVVGSFTPWETAVDELTPEEARIRIYPNPTTGVIQFDLEEFVPSDFEVRTFNALGQLLVTQRLNTSQMDLSRFDNGIYYLQIKNTKTNRFTSNKVVIFKD